MDVCIKNIDEENWRMFKSESIKHGLKVGEFFNKIVKEHNKSCCNNWNSVLNGEKKLKGILSKDDLKEIRTRFRKSVKMRTV